MTSIPHDLIEALRNELKEYGEMLALLDEQQEHVIARRTDAVLDNVRRVNVQAAVLEQLRAARDEAALLAACAMGLASDCGVLELVDALPEQYGPMLKALISENNQLLGRVQARVRQNHLLLSRCMELMSRLIQSLTPSFQPVLYGNDGVMQGASGTYSLYEAVG